MNRRNFLTALSALPIVGPLFAAKSPAVKAVSIRGKAGRTKSVLVYDPARARVRELREGVMVCDLEEETLTGRLYLPHDDDRVLYAFFCRHTGWMVITEDELNRQAWRGMRGYERLSEAKAAFLKDYA
jgi:hypothetical protein